ncbi:MAG: hypothetical protein O2898_00025 [Proteobacteria bacterium]|nr:hypothetical protein [Pseudomonadota bacterium]
MARFSAAKAGLLRNPRFIIDPPSTTPAMADDFRNLRLSNFMMYSRWLSPSDSFFSHPAFFGGWLYDLHASQGFLPDSVGSVDIVVSLIKQPDKYFVDCEAIVVFVDFMRWWQNSRRRSNGITRSHECFPTAAVISSYDVPPKQAAQSKSAKAFVMRKDPDG